MLARAAGSGAAPDPLLPLPPHQLSATLFAVGSAVELHKGAAPAPSSGNNIILRCCKTDSLKQPSAGEVAICHFNVLLLALPSFGPRTALQPAVVGIY